VNYPYGPDGQNDEYGRVGVGMIQREKCTRSGRGKASCAGGAGERRETETQMTKRKRVCGYCWGGAHKRVHFLSFMSDVEQLQGVRQW